MAETKTVKLNVESNVDEVTQEFKKTGSAIETATADVNQFNKQTVKGSADVVKSQKKVQNSIKKTTKEAKKAGKSFDQFKDAGEGLKGSFETAQGAMELFGAESEATGQAVQKNWPSNAIGRGPKRFKSGNRGLVRVW